MSTSYPVNRTPPSSVAVSYILGGYPKVVILTELPPKFELRGLKTLLPVPPPVGLHSSARISSAFPGLFGVLVGKHAKPYRYFFRLFSAYQKAYVEELADTKYEKDKCQNLSKGES